MNNQFQGAYSASAERQDAVPYTVSRRSKLSTCVAFAIASASLMASYEAEAATKKSTKKVSNSGDSAVNALQAQVDRLNEELAASKRRELELIKRGAASAAPASAAAAGSAAAPVTEAGLDLAQAEAAAPEKEEKEEKAKNLGEVVVRSRHRLEKLQDIPLSVSVVSGKELEREQAMDLGAITKRAANISWNQGNQRTSSISIRGVGKVGQTEAQDPSVGVIVDGVNYAYNPLSSSYDFTDIDAVEVTRGPQGTLQGKSTNQGFINITTKRPTFTPEANYSLTYGTYDTYIGKGAVGGALIDNLLAWRGSFNVQKQRGDIKNAYNPDNTYQNIDRLSGRAQFLLTPTENFNARLAIDIQPRSGENTNGRTFYTPTPLYSNGTAVSNDASVNLARRWFKQNGDYSYLGNYLFGNGGTNAVNNNSQQPVVTGSNGAAFEMNWDVLNHHFTSLTAFKDYHFNAHNNDEGTPFDIKSSGGYLNNYSQLSQELRLASKTGGLLDYQGGIYLLDVRNKTEFNNIYGHDAGAWYATTAQYNRLDTNNNGRMLMQNSLDGLWTDTFNQDIHNQSGAVFGQTNFHFTDDITLSTGVRFTNEHRENPNFRNIRFNGNGAELNPDKVNGINLGGFASTSNGTLGTNNATQLALADAVAQKYFGVASTGVAGGAYNSLTAAQKQQVADAKTIRAGEIGTVWDQNPSSFNGTLPSWTVSPSYKINPDQTAYVSWQHGAKAGISQTVNGNDALAKSEINDTYEVGLKSAFFDKTLILNTDVFWSNIKNYQTQVQAFDAYKTSVKNDGNLYYTSTTGNVPDVRVAGVELDGAYNGLKYTSIRFAGAYTDAIYVNFTNAAQAAENAFTGAAPFADLSGKTLPGAAKFTANISPEFRIPSEVLGIDALGKTDFHTSFTTSFTSKYNSDSNLSSYGWIRANFRTDFAIGVGRRDKLFDVSFVAKNLFDDTTHTTQTWNSYQPAFPRWYGLQLSGKF